MFQIVLRGDAVQPAAQLVASEKLLSQWLSLTEQALLELALDLEGERDLIEVASPQISDPTGWNSM
jgi:hypothetical protein